MSKEKSQHHEQRRKLSIPLSSSSVYTLPIKFGDLFKSTDTKSQIPTAKNKWVIQVSDAGPASTMFKSIEQEI